MELQFLAWTEEYAIGHLGLDAEHRQLVDAINKVSTVESSGGSCDELRSLLKALKILAVKHFKHENTFLNELGCLAARLQTGRPAIKDIIRVCT